MSDYYRQVVWGYTTELKDKIRKSKLKIGYHQNDIANLDRPDDWREKDEKYLGWEQDRLRAYEAILLLVQTL